MVRQSLLLLSVVVSSLSIVTGQELNTSVDDGFTKREKAKPDVAPAETLNKKEKQNATEATGVGEVASEKAKAPTPQTAPASQWEFSVTPYFFLAGMNGRVGALGQTVEVKAKFVDIFEDLNFAVMGTFVARKNNWMFVGDAMYISLSGQKATPSLLISDVNVDTKLTVIDPEVGYRAFSSEGGFIDVLGGVRIWRVRNRVAFKPILLPFVDVSDTKTWADPVVGVRGTARLSPRVFAIGRFDAGGFGVSSDFTGQAFGGLGFQVRPRFALVGGYRYLFVNYHHEGFTFESALKGLALGAQFRF
jgi:hypothetical protein